MVKSEDWEPIAWRAEVDPVVLDGPTLAHNWDEFRAWFFAIIDENSVLRQQRDRNLIEAQMLVGDIPLIHSFRSPELVLPGIVAHGGLLSRSTARESGAPIPNIAGISSDDFDREAGIDGHVSAYFGNIGSVLYGDFTFIIDPRIITSCAENFFVMESDTAMFRGDFYPKNIKNAVLPADKFSEFIAQYIAAFYQTPRDYLTMTADLHGDYLRAIRAPVGHVDINRGCCYSPELRIKDRILKEAIIGYCVYGSPDLGAEKLLEQYVPHVSVVRPKDKNEKFGEMVMRFLASYRQDHRYE